MATVIHRVLACDKCGSEDDVKRYTITFPKAGRRTCDLCGSDREPLVELEGLYEGKPQGRKIGASVVSEKDIEAARRSSGRRTAKKASRRKP